MNQLKSAFKYDNVVTPFKGSDCEQYVTRELNEYYSLERVESDIPGIYTEIYSSTTCSRCMKQLGYVHFRWKTKCNHCGLWIAHTEREWMNIHGETIPGTLLVWDTSVLKPPRPPREKMTLSRILKWLKG